MRIAELYEKMRKKDMRIHKLLDSEKEREAQAQAIAQMSSALRQKDQRLNELAREIESLKLTNDRLQKKAEVEIKRLNSALRKALRKDHVDRIKYLSTELSRQYSTALRLSLEMLGPSLSHDLKELHEFKRVSVSPTIYTFDNSCELMYDEQDLDSADIEDTGIEINTCRLYARNMKAALEMLLRKANRYRQGQGAAAADLSRMESELIKLDRQRSRLKRRLKALEEEKARVEDLVKGSFDISAGSKEARTLSDLQERFSTKREKICLRLNELEASHQGVSFSDFMHVVRRFDGFNQAGSGSESVSSAQD